MSTRPYVENVYSNLKSPRPNGDAWSIDIGPKTLLVGSNTSHKSTVVQAIELAIAGSADDIIGRSIVSDAALLLTLAPGDELGVTAIQRATTLVEKTARSRGLSMMGRAHLAWSTVQSRLLFRGRRRQQEKHSCSGQVKTSIARTS